MKNLLYLFLLFIALHIENIGFSFVIIFSVLITLYLDNLKPNKNE
jgi:hypothetical protein